jgi:hypothetical protein
MVKATLASQLIFPTDGNSIHNHWIKLKILMKKTRSAERSVNTD